MAYYRKRTNEHRKVWKSVNGNIPKGKHIHHIDGNADNNHIDNLICVSAEMHHAIHKQQFEQYGNPKDAYATNRLSWFINGNTVKAYKGPNTGKTFSSEWVDNISKSHIGNRSGNAKHYWLNTETGIFYYTSKSAAESIGMKPRTFKAQMDGQNPNKTSFKRI